MSLVSRDEERNLVVWTWTHHARYRSLYRGLMEDGSWDHATVHHVRRSREAPR